jgi:titin
VAQSGLAVAVGVAGAPPGFALGGTLAAVTDADGRAHFADLVGTGAPGTYTLQFTGTGATGAALTPVARPVEFTGAAAAPTPTPPAPAAVDPARSTVVLSAPTVASAGTVTATITPRDAAGAAMGAGLTVAVAVPASPAPGAATATVTAATDRGDGTYTATLTGVRAGTALSVTATVNGVALAAAPTLAVTPGAPRAAASTLAVSATALAPGQTATVTVAVADSVGNVVTGAAPADVSLSASVGTLGAATCAGGTCTATYTATTSGTAAITATVGGAPAAGSPATITVASTLVATRAVASRTLTAGGPAAAFTPVTATGGTAPYTFTLGAPLPAGLTFDAATGAVGGTATAALPADTVTVTVTDAAGTTAAERFALTVNPALVATQAVPTTTLTVGTGHAHFFPVTVAGGTAPRVFALTGALPAGLTFDAATGAVGGTATTALAATTFTVTATDSVGATASATFELRVDGPPSAPALGAVTPGDGALTVAFTAPATDGGSEIVGYSYSTDDGATWSAAAPAATPLVVAGLTNGTTYHLRLRAENAVGAGAASAAATGTPATTPSAPAITGVTAGAGELGIAFTPPAESGGAPVTNYQYSLDGGATWQTRAPASAASPLVIGGLTNGTTYQVALRAVNAVGAGAASAPASGTPRAVAGAPTALTADPGNGQVTLHWVPPASDGGEAITDYTVQYSSNNGPWITAPHAPSTATTLTVGGLANGTVYLFHVAAVTAAGTGPASASVPATPGTAGAPTGLAVTFNQTSATAQDGTLTWTAPASTGSASITDYAVEYKLAGATTWTALSRPASAATSATFTGLGVATTYDFRVSATTSVGTGARSAVLTAKTTGPSERLACTTPGTSNASTDEIDIAPCAGVQVGNLIVVPVTIGRSSLTPDLIKPDTLTSAGFTAVSTQANGNSQTTIFTKVATAADVGRTAPYRFTWSNNVKTVITLVTYKGVDVNAVGVTAVHGTGATATSQAAAVNDADRYTLAYIYTMADVPLPDPATSVGNWTVSTGIWKNTTTGTNNNNAAAVLTADVDRTARGTLAPQTATNGGMKSTTKWHAAVLVLRPAQPRAAP